MFDADVILLLPGFPTLSEGSTLSSRTTNPQVRGNGGKGTKKPKPAKARKGAKDTIYAFLLALFYFYNAPVLQSRCKG